MATILGPSEIGRAAEQKLILRLFFHNWDLSEFDLASHCTPRPDGMLYVALGRHVFRWPLDRPPMFEALGSTFDDIEDPVPPIPTDAYGCAGNPLPVQAIGMDMTEEGTRLPSSDGAAAFVRISRLPPGQPWDLMVKAREEFFDLVCGGVTTISPQGLLRCTSDKLSDPDEKNKRASEYLTNFKTLPEVYADPFGNPFYISCAGLEPPTCRVHYELYEDVGLRFEFHRSELKIGKVLDFDRALRSLIADAEVKDFVWADPN